jgi:hypothetical protein
MTISGSGSVPPSVRVLNRSAQAYGVASRPPAPAPAVPPTAESAASGLRAVLNDEERAYFDQIASLGPITYGRGRSAAVTADVPTGLRLDVRG